MVHFALLLLDIEFDFDHILLDIFRLDISSDPQQSRVEADTWLVGLDSTRSGVDPLIDIEVVVSTSFLHD